MGYNEIFAQFRKVATGLLEVTDADMDNYHKVLKDGGFSYNHGTGKSPESGYMVSYPQRLGGVNMQVPAHEFSPHHLAEHRQRMEMAGHHLNPDVYQGGWSDGHTVHLDVSHNVHDRDEALRKGRDFDQKAIYHLDSGDEIDTGGTGNS